jgi:hypothetical protein
MKRKTIFIALAIFMISFSTIGCGNETTKQNLTDNTVISQTDENYNLQGTWTRSDGDLSFIGSDTGSYSFDSTGMYDETGTYSIASNGTITCTSKDGNILTYDKVSLDELKDGKNGWCIDGDILYWGYEDYTFTKK